MDRRDAVPVAWLWALSLVLAWVAVALALQQDVMAEQVSRALVAFGALKGRDLTTNTAWRLVAAQWLHVRFGHMLLNAAVIAIVGTAVERRTSPLTMLRIGVLGGTAGTLAGAVDDPGGFVSGASQACLSLCGAAAITLEKRRATWWIAVVATAIAIALDFRASGTIKTGHILGLAFGTACGASIVHRRPTNRRAGR